MIHDVVIPATIERMAQLWPDRPVELIPGEEEVERFAVDGSTVHFTRPRGTPDRFRPASDSRGSPCVRWECVESWEAIIRTRSSKGGARYIDHEEECQCVVDAITEALAIICQREMVDFKPTGGGIVDTESSANDGVTYVLQFTIARSVHSKPVEKVRARIGSGTATVSFEGVTTTIP